MDKYTFAENTECYPKCEESLVTLVYIQRKTPESPGSSEIYPSSRMCTRTACDPSHSLVAQQPSSLAGSTCSCEPLGHMASSNSEPALPWVQERPEMRLALDFRGALDALASLLASTAVLKPTSSRGSLKSGYADRARPKVELRK